MDPLYPTIGSDNSKFYQPAAKTPQQIQQTAIASMYPRETMANIIRNQWTDFESTALPVKAQLEKMTTYNGNAGVLPELQKQALTEAQGAYGNLATDATRQVQRYGMNLTADQTGALSKAANTGMAASTVDGLNRANQFQSDLNRQITAGSTLANAKNIAG